LLPFGTFYGNLVYFVDIFQFLGILYQEQSGNPGSPAAKRLLIAGNHIKATLL
jgi:hypothetical protein